MVVADSSTEHRAKGFPEESNPDAVLHDAELGNDDAETLRRVEKMYRWVISRRYCDDSSILTASLGSWTGG